MKRILCAMILLSVSVASLSGLAAAQDGPMNDDHVQLPTIPAPVAVELEAATTAFLVLDLNEAVCTPRPMCPPTLPEVASLLARARAAGVTVVYTSGRTPTQVLAPVTPRGDEPLVMAGANKFFQTELDQILVGAGANTLVIVGVSANGAPMYTSFEANSRGYTVVVAEDGLSAASDFDLFLARYQLLNQPGFDNPQNNPLMAGRVTLSRTDLITFR